MEPIRCITVNSLNISCVALVAIVSLVTSSFMVQQAEGAFEPMPCPSCVTITEQNLEVHKQNSPIIIWTDSTVYDRNSEIQINGFSKNFNPQLPVTLTVFNPRGNVILVKQVNFNSEGEFSETAVPSGDDWKLNGKYIIKAQQSSGRVFRTQVDIIGDYKGKHVECGPRQLSLVSQRDSSGIYCVPYSMTGGTIKESTLDVKDKSIILKIDSNDEGVLTLNIPRFILDSKGKTDDNFGVFVDDTQVVPHNEVRRDRERILTVGVKEGASEIRIDGNIVLTKQKDIVCLPSEIAFVSDTVGTHCVPYSIKGATIQNGILDVKQKALIVNIESHDQGLMTLHIPRKVLDSKQTERETAKDTSFMVFVDGKSKSIHKEQRDEDKRTITFGFAPGSETVKIVGTQVVPEFSDVVLYLILAASMMVPVVMFRNYNKKCRLLEQNSIRK